MDEGLSDEIRARKRYAGKLGWLACVEKYGAQAMGRRRYEGRRRKIAAEIDPLGLLSEAERTLLVDYRIKAVMIRVTEARRRRRLERAQGRTEDEMNTSIQFIAHPPVFCVHCTPRSEWPENGSGGICATCAAKVLRSVA